jgi:integrase
MASIIVEGKGGERRWSIRWREGGRGTKQHRSDRFKTKREAEDFLADIKVKLLRLKTSGAKRAIGWREVYERWLAQFKPESRHYIESRRKIERTTAAWRSTRDATPTAMAELPIGNARVVRAVLRWAELHLDQFVDHRALKVAPKRIRAKRVRPTLLTEKEVQRLMAAAAETGPGNGALVHLIAVYGHRAENLVRLTAQNFKNGHLQFRVKGGDEVRHPLLPATVALIKPLLKLGTPGTPIFLNHLGKPWKDGKEFAAWFGHFFAVGYYQLKRAAISRLLARGVDAKTVASITGHKTVSLLLDVYASTNEQRQAAALAALSSGTLPGVPSVCPENAVSP